MIVSHRHRFIFAAIPKTGTHSVRRALREQMGPDDIEQVGLFVQKQFPFPELARLGHGHVTLQQVRGPLGEETFASYLKFAFVRNPFDRFVSYCAFMTRHGDAFERRPRDVMAYFLFDNPPEAHVLFQPQHIFVVGEDGGLLADQLGRTEEMQASFDAICARLGIASATLETVNASQHRDYRAYYDQRLIDGVAQRYARDLALFGYDF